MATLQPGVFFKLRVRAGKMDVTPNPDYPARYHITMAAIDPSAPPKDVEGPLRSTLKVTSIRLDDGDDSDDGSSDDGDMDSDEFEELQAQLGAEEDTDDESNGGPSNPAQRAKAQKDALLKQLMEDAAEQEKLEGVNGINGVHSDKGKGKAKATDEDEESDDESIDVAAAGASESVLCTLDPHQHYQQPLDITITETEQAFFKTVGTHDIFLSGNYVIPVDNDHYLDNESESDEDEDDIYSMEGDMDIEEGSSEDELDDIDDPRVTEVDSDEDVDMEAPLLVEATTGKAAKGKKKRVASDSYDDAEKTVSLDDLINKSLKPSDSTTNGEKLSKKQAKRLKNNAGQAVAAKATEDKPASTKEPEAAAKSGAANGKKVQFAKNLEQGPTPTKAEAQKADKSKDGKPKPNIRNVQGVKIDDKKIGTGPAAKKGDKVAMRYIGKLEKNNQVFDANKKGAPFTFKLGAGEVIKGWDIGVAGMQVGGERRITVPANLAYGSSGAPGIPAHSNLIFEIKMLSLK